CLRAVRARRRLAFPRGGQHGARPGHRARGRGRARRTGDGGQRARAHRVRRPPAPAPGRSPGRDGLTGRPQADHTAVTARLATVDLMRTDTPLGAPPETPLRTLPVRGPVTVVRGRPMLDVVIPVYNEEADLERCVRRLHDHLARTFPYGF